MSYRPDIDAPVSGVSSSVYTLYGLRLRSSIPLPCQLADPMLGNDDPVDIDFKECSASELQSALNSDITTADENNWGYTHLYKDGSARVCLRQHFEFVISGDGKKVLWRRLSEVPTESALTYLLGQAMSFSLLAHGIEPLHATAVVIEGHAIALMGDSGQGKSTLAAAFLSRGYPLLTDDILVLEFRDGGVLAHSSVPHIKLTPESADSVYNGERSVLMNAFASKMVFPLSEDKRQLRAAPLHAIYILPPQSSKPSRTILRTLKGKSAFLPLIANTFNCSVQTSPRWRQQFAFATRVAATVPVKQLYYERRFERISEVVERILRDTVPPVGRS